MIWHERSRVQEHTSAKWSGRVCVRVCHEMTRWMESVVYWCRVVGGCCVFWWVLWCPTFLCVGSLALVPTIAFINIASTASVYFTIGEMGETTNTTDCTFFAPAAKQHKNSRAKYGRLFIGLAQPKPVTSFSLLLMLLLYFGLSAAVVVVVVVVFGFHCKLTSISVGFRCAFRFARTEFVQRRTPSWIWPVHGIQI